MTLIETEQDMDTEYVRKFEPDLYAKIWRRVMQDGFTPEQVDEWFDWPPNTKWRDLTVNTAKSLYRKKPACAESLSASNAQAGTHADRQTDELEAAQEALTNICTGADPVRCDDPNCPVHTKEHS